MFGVSWKISLARFARRTVGHCKSIIKTTNVKYVHVGGLLLGLGSGISVANCSATGIAAKRHAGMDIDLFRPGDGYSRIDGKIENIRPEVLSNNAFHGTLRGENLIEDYEVYYNEAEKDIICLVRFGKSLNGHNGIVHGGITALTFDNSFGWLFIANETAPAFTANLSINYRCAYTSE
jgi:hypothetical protein